MFSEKRKERVMPKVSIIIPSHNRAKLIGRALESVFQQTYKDYEVVVVDDASTDNTQEILASYGDKIRHFRQPQKSGSAGARNRGLQEAQGEYIAFLDSDDFWVPEKLAEQVKVLDAHKNVGIVYSKMAIINTKGERCGTKPEQKSGKNYKELLEIWGDIPTSTVLTRRECFDKAGKFDTSLITMQDIDMWLRIARHYDLYEIEDKMLSYYYRHGDQNTGSRIRIYEGLVTLFKKIFYTYEDAPKALYLRKIAMYQYTLSREYYREKFYKKSWQNAVESIKRYPLVGKLFFYKDDHLLSKLFKFVKPYGFLVVCTARVLFNGQRTGNGKDGRT
jgi:glycosyltransferase involved in cell wall biosynthesis